MKKYFRRALSLLVAFTMFFMIFSSTAFAAETEKIQAIKVSDNSVTFTNSIMTVLLVAAICAVSALIILLIKKNR